MSADYGQSGPKRVVDPVTGDPHAVVQTNQARQGVTGNNVRYVLGFGVAAIVVVFAGIWLYYFG